MAETDDILEQLAKRRYTMRSLCHRLGRDGKPLSLSTVKRLARKIERIQFSRKDIVFTEPAVRRFEQSRTLLA